jgi:hypothetical protein
VYCSATTLGETNSNRVEAQCRRDTLAQSRRPNISPAFAAEFFVAQSASTHKCSVTSKKPDGKAMMLVGTDTYKSKPDAMKAMKGMSECKA